MELEDLTKDDINDLCARSLSDLEIKSYWNRDKIIKSVRGRLKKEKLDEADFISTLFKVSDDNSVGIDVKCHNCGNDMKFLRESPVNSDIDSVMKKYYECLKCHAKVTVMR